MNGRAAGRAEGVKGLWYKNVPLLYLECTFKVVCFYQKEMKNGGRDLWEKC